MDKNGFSKIWFGFRLVALVSLIISAFPSGTSHARQELRTDPCAALAQEAAIALSARAASTTLGKIGQEVLSAPIKADLVKRLDEQSAYLPEAQLDLSQVALFGELYGVGSACLVMNIFEPVNAGQDVHIYSSESLPGSGIKGRTITVLISPNTYRVPADLDLEGLPPGSPLLVGGSLSGNTLSAAALIDFRQARVHQPSTPELEISPAHGYWKQIAPAKSIEPPQTQAQAFSPTDTGPTTLDFRGSAYTPVYEYTEVLTTTLFDYEGVKVTVTGLSIIASQAYFYDFPFRFTANPLAQTDNLIPVSLQVLPQSPAEGNTFFGSSAMSILMTFRIQTPYGCPPWGTGPCDYDMELNMGVGMVNISTEPAPLPGKTLKTNAISCTFLTIIASSITMDLCEDWSLTGASFNANLSAQNGEIIPKDNTQHPTYSFTGDSQTVVIRPTGDPVELTLDSFAYTPQLKDGLFLRFSVLGNPIYETVTLEINDACDLPAIANTAGDRACKGMRYEEQKEEVLFSIPVDTTPPLVEFTYSADGKWPSIAKVKDTESGLANLSVNCKFGSLVPVTDQWAEFDFNVPAYAPGTTDTVEVNANSKFIASADLECGLWAADVAGNQSWNVWTIQPSAQSSLKIDPVGFALFLPAIIHSTLRPSVLQSAGPVISFTPVITSPDTPVYLWDVATVQDTSSGLASVSVNCKIKSLFPLGSWPDWAVLDVNFPAYSRGTKDPLAIRGIHQNITSARMQCGVWAANVGGQASWKLYQYTP